MRHELEPPWALDGYAGVNASGELVTRHIDGLDNPPRVELPPVPST